MARSFVAASSQYMEAASAVVTGAPCTFAAWFIVPSSGNNIYCMPSIYHSSDSTRYLYLGADDVAVYAGINDGTTEVSAATTAAPALGNWHHGCAVFASTTSRTAYIDGGNSATNTVLRGNPTGVDRTAIGRLRSTAANHYYATGTIAEVAIWNVALAVDEVAELASGLTPLLVRPESLVAYWPVMGAYSPEIDPVGGVDLTLTNTPAVADHPRVFHPRRQQALRVAAMGTVHSLNLSEALGSNESFGRVHDARRKWIRRP